ncbi:bifunctional phosphopantothenoylcysteine decarboxylase/phosphopantothenate--cysteine ligase CoaBC [Jonesia denitrificans]|uniref:Coenzyme A biosynthesis bifunctional protein CoaBC n=1 Tax=Jonesia denitrificans (strain ATCC 14870 / DSM 20603 / BCRC 15368 / CIP 55.134 / JCM 11481 / NBRC 15587 / NCTC 10816 / Prevot 55134) TaxID=471856 RepID=C7R4B5_JONDD|nr:bifunctional phosphopantothenoylcysteine decarboxylase/phosphopantothenate--cysteine ligase CoaBC [Jonesia denitrificans]ACV08972.1 phosphopantothenoylcysteine decarboxylase/phosphopantothenate/cysteine ligase [Jonesia denitrificans DSM 20603]ASE10176.1 bifunctional phosphopantothenoylcysteine decarboxylase/phosphopantothenate--cysteine ligase CoaBC [Jonesia denitrificans]QXB44263.1 bifunctional phosphopantothenoylcysteine decarboxylase/phosphopantothenate--cysteine ligase CoaBC [Jonesia deni
MNIVVGVGAGIAAYKVAHVVRLFTEQGHHVRVVPTPGSLHFVGQATWEALSGQPATTSVFDHVPDVDHIHIGQHADLIVIAPATADLISRLATGRADDLLTATALVTTAPVVLAPAMHTEMWQHPATQHNVKTLKKRGVTVLDPATGRLTGKDTGPGRLPEPPEIVTRALAAHAASTSTAHQDLTGRTVLVTAGGTREPIDPVRFLGNRSSGRQGVAIAAAAHRRGATVTLIGAHLTVPTPPGIDLIPVTTAEQMHTAVLAHAPSSDIIIMAAAVADYRPIHVLPTKAKKDGTGLTHIELTANPDILADIATNRRRAGQLIVGFAAETGDDTGSVIEHGIAKAQRKGADLLAINEVGTHTGFGDVPNTITLVTNTGQVLDSISGTKDDVANHILNTVVHLLSTDGDVPTSNSPHTPV